MRQKFGNFGISMREGFDQKNQPFEGCCWLKFNNLRLALVMALKFYTSVTKSQKVLGANSYVCRSYREKMEGGGGGLFGPSIS